MQTNLYWTIGKRRIPAKSGLSKLTLVVLLGILLTLSLPGAAVKWLLTGETYVDATGNYAPGWAAILFGFALIAALVVIF